MADDGIDVQQRAERAWLDIHQTHLRDHDPRLVAARRTQIEADWPTWRPQRAATDGGTLRE